MKAAHDTVLHHRVDINQKIAARDEVKFGKWRVFYNAVRRKYAHFANLRQNDRFIAVQFEPPLQTFWRHSGNRQLIAPQPGHRDGTVVNVGAENLDFRLWTPVADRFTQQYGNGVGFVPCGTPRHPDPNRFIRTLVGDKTFQNRFIQGIKGGRIAEELGYANQ